MRSAGRHLTECARCFDRCVSASLQAAPGTTMPTQNRMIHYRTVLPFVGMHVCGECGQRYEREGFCTRDGSPLADTDDELLGLELGRYRIARLLGEGGMGR